MQDSQHIIRVLMSSQSVNFFVWTLLLFVSVSMEIVILLLFETVDDMSNVCSKKPISSTKALSMFDWDLVWQGGQPIKKKVIAMNVGIGGSVNIYLVTSFWKKINKGNIYFYHRQFKWNQLSSQFCWTKKCYLNCQCSFDYHTIHSSIV